MKTNDDVAVSALRALRDLRVLLEHDLARAQRHRLGVVVIDLAEQLAGVRFALAALRGTYLDHDRQDRIA